MPINATCPHCGHTVKAPDNAGGKKGKCPRCGGIVPIPDLPHILDDEDEPSPYAASPSTATMAPITSGSGFVPAATAPPVSSYVPPASSPVDPGVIAMVTGKPANAWGYRSSFGRTTLALTHYRLKETTRRPIEERDCEFMLADVDSVELIAKGNPTYIGLAMTSIGLAGVNPLFLLVPVLFAVLFFLLKHRFLIVRSQANAMILGVKGDERPVREFQALLLDELQRLKYGA